MIDDHLPDSWPDSVLSAVKEFRQGDLVAEPPFFYYGAPSAAVWELTRDDSEDAAPDVFALDDGSFAWGVITTQTCDIQEEGRPRKPWFQVAPVYELTHDDGLWNQIKKRRVSYLTHMSGLEPGFWIADTRIELPVEKSWLVERERCPGFKTQDEYVAFSEHLATNRRRPALAASIIDFIVKPLRSALQSLSLEEQTEVLERVDELLLDIAGDRVEPESVQLVVLTPEACPPSVREWFESWWDSARETAATTLNVLRPRFEHAGDGGLPVAEYRRMVSLPWSDLSPESV